MTRRPRSLCASALFTVAVLVAAGPLSADWPMFRGDPGLSGISSSDPGIDLKPIWRFEAEDGFEGTAAIVDGRVFVTSLDGHLYALDPATGKLLWSYKADSEYATEIKSSPTVFDGVVYFGDEGGVFHAVDAATGKARWTYTTENSVVSSANLFDTEGGAKVLFGSYDQYLYALDAKTGKVAWKVESDSYIHASPSVANGYAYIGGCDAVFRKVRLSDGKQMGTIGVGAYIAGGTAVVGTKGYVGTFEEEVLGLDLETETVLWRYRNPDRSFPFYSSPAANDEIVIIGGRDKSIHAIDPETGEARWTYTTPARVDSSPVIAGPRVWVASKSGHLYALNLESGEPDWQFETGEAIVASPALSDDLMVISTLDGSVLAFSSK